MDYGINGGWAGLYEITPDRNQIIDRCTEVDGLLIATGYSGHGFLMAPATGEIVRDLYLGKEPATASASSPSIASHRSTSLPAKPTSSDSTGAIQCELVVFAAVPPAHL